VLYSLYKYIFIYISSLRVEPFLSVTVTEYFVVELPLLQLKASNSLYISLFLEYFAACSSSESHLKLNSYLIGNRRESLIGITAGVRFPAMQELFLLFMTSRPALRPAQPPRQWILGAISLGKKQLGREADHSPQSSAEVENGGAISSLPRKSSWHSV
jgi:hypothetical protein